MPDGPNVASRSAAPGPLSVEERRRLASLPDDLPLTTPAVWMHIEALEPWAENPRRITTRAVAKARASLEANGWGAPILASWPLLRIVAGHTRRLALLQLLEAKPGWRAPGSPGPGMVPVRFHVVDGEAGPRWATWEESEGLALADNRTAEEAEWDTQLLAKVLQRHQAEVDQFLLRARTGFDDEEVARFIRGLRAPVARNVDDPGPSGLPDDEHADSQVGGVYELGPHRLTCGDARDAGAWPRVLLAGEQLACLWTDPPYGVRVTGGSRAFSDDERVRQGGKRIENDDLSEADLAALLDGAFEHALAACRPGAAWYVAGPQGPLGHVFTGCLRTVRHGAKTVQVYRHMLIWVKDRFMMGRADHQYGHEPVYYGWRPDGPHAWHGGRDKSSVFTCPRPARSDLHPTMKPPPLIEAMLENSTLEGELVGDAFTGSGSTLVACARLGRVFRGIELSRAYCDVIRDRWTRWAIEAGQDPGPGALRLNRG